MALLSLTMLLLVLMVTMTLAFATRVKEKMELQTVADAAAYSNAVETARTYNSLATLNRVQIGHMVAMAGTQSLISWSGYYKSFLAYGIVANTRLAGAWFSRASYCCCARRVLGACIPTWCCPLAPCLVAGGAAILARAAPGTPIWVEWERVGNGSTPLGFASAVVDGFAGDEVRKIINAAERIYTDGQLPLYDQLDTDLSGQRVARGIVTSARAGSATPAEWRDPPTD
ncbi:MAG: hypothetical protein ACOZIN_17175, partial [Myxococcota bacterium]